MTNLGHLMVDIESMGNSSDSVICSLGAVEFSIETGEIGRKFYEVISIQSCLNAGLHVDGSTIEWWLLQNESARTEIAKGGKNIGEVLHLFRLFLESLGTEELQVWGNSARFDLGIIENAYKKLFPNKPVPWKYSKERDVRTLVAFNPEIKKNVLDEFKEESHLPINDCLKQILYCVKIYNSMRNVTNAVL